MIEATLVSFALFKAECKGVVVVDGNVGETLVLRGVVSS